MKDFYQDCFWWLIRQPYIEPMVRHHLDIQANRGDTTSYYIETLEKISGMVGADSFKKEPLSILEGDYYKYVGPDFPHEFVKCIVSRKDRLNCQILRSCGERITVLKDTLEK